MGALGFTQVPSRGDQEGALQRPREPTRTVVNRHRARCCRAGRGPARRGLPGAYGAARWAGGQRAPGASWHGSCPQRRSLARACSCRLPPPSSHRASLCSLFFHSWLGPPVMGKTCPSAGFPRGPGAGLGLLPPGSAVGTAASPAGSSGKQNRRFAGPGPGEHTLHGSSVRKTRLSVQSRAALAGSAGSADGGLCTQQDAGAAVPGGSCHCVSGCARSRPQHHASSERTGPAAADHGALEQAPRPPSRTHLPIPTAGPRERPRPSEGIGAPTCPGCPR